MVKTTLWLHQTTTSALILTADAFTKQTISFSLKSFSTTSLKMGLASMQDAITAHNKDNNIFIDGSWHMPKTRNGRREYMMGPRIEGAKYFDIDDVCAANAKKLPHMKPSSHQFGVAMDLMKITPTDTLYIYANNNCKFSHRAYWTFASFHDPTKVKLLQGSLDEWESLGGKLDLDELNDDNVFRMPSDWQDRIPLYKCHQTSEKNTVTLDEMMEIVNNQTAIVIDARSAGRFVGDEPEPRPGLRGGHMPHALNIPFVSLLLEKDGTKFKPMDEVKQFFLQAGIRPYEDLNDDSGKKIVCSCGSGVTAAALAVGLEVCGLRKREDIYIYDGSWIEWGGNEDTLVIKGE